jgi:hypothetical protein
MDVGSTPAGPLRKEQRSAVAYERSPASAGAHVAGSHRRHEPEKTVLHAIVRDHLETFLERGRGEEGAGYPRFVERQFRFRKRAIASGC